MNWRKLIGLAVMTAAGELFAAPPPSVAQGLVPEVSPVLRLFPRAVTFMQTFDDDSLLPDVGMPPANWREPAAEFVDGGVRGRCLAAGGTWLANDRFGEPLVDTTVPGTAICWVRYMEEQPAGQLAKDEPGFTFFCTHQDQKPKAGRILAMKSHRHGDMFVMYEYYTDRRKTASARQDSTFRNWKPGVWRMVVFCWTQNQIGMSIDGLPFDMQSYDKRLGSVAGFGFEAPAVNGKSRFFQIDECAILNRKISNKGVKRLYDEYQKGLR